MKKSTEKKLQKMEDGIGFFHILFCFLFFLGFHYFYFDDFKFDDKETIEKMKTKEECMAIFSKGFE